MDEHVPESLPTSAEDAEARDIQENKDIAAFSYLWIMSVVVYVLRKNSPFVRFHSKQAMVLFIVSIVVWIIPIIGRLLELIVLAGMVIGFVAAAQGKKQDVPIVGPLSRGEITLRQAWKQIVDTIAGIVRGFSSGMNSTHTESKTDTAKPTDSPGASSSNPPSVP